MKLIYQFIFLTLLCSSFGCRTSSETVFGKYTTFLPKYVERTVLKYKHNASLAPMWVMMVYLRDDNTFIMGSCDLQIWEAGTFTIEEDTVKFENVYSFKNSSYIKNQAMLYDSKKGYIYYRYPTKDSSQVMEYPEAIAILRKDFKRSHRGFLRNQEMPLDSLIRFNEFLPLDSQYVWIDRKLGR